MYLVTYSLFMTTSVFDIHLCKDIKLEVHGQK